MNTHIHTTPGGDAFLPATIIDNPRRNLNRKRPPEPSPLGVWILLALGIIFSSLTTYILTK
jgi:predicted permease